MYVVEKKGTCIISNNIWLDLYNMIHVIATLLDVLDSVYIFFLNNKECMTLVGTCPNLTLQEPQDMQRNKVISYTS